MQFKRKIAIIDYGIGNVRSVSNCLLHLGYVNTIVTSDPAIISTSDVLILPGVGAFDVAMDNLSASGLIPVIENCIFVQRKPLLGICLGMQLLAESSIENGFHKGLGWISGKISLLQPGLMPVPHVGWNQVSFSGDSPLFGRNKSGDNFYFDHSYYYEGGAENILATTDYGIKIPCAIRRDNVFGVQFHPEKSSANGLKLFRNFIESSGKC